MNGQFAFGYPLVPNIVRKDFGAGIAVNVMRRKIACHHVMARTSAELGWVQPHGLARPVAAFAVGSGIHDPDCLPARPIRSSGGVTSVVNVSRGFAPEGLAGMPPPWHAMVPSSACSHLMASRIRRRSAGHGTLASSGAGKNIVRGPVRGGGDNERRGALQEVDDCLPRRTGSTALHGLASLPARQYVGHRRRHGAIPPGWFIRLVAMRAGVPREDAIRGLVPARHLA